MSRDSDSDQIDPIDVDEFAPLPIREPQLVIPLPVVAILSDMELLRRVKAGLERLE